MDHVRIPNNPVATLPPRPGSKQTSRPGSKQHPSRQGSKESADVKLPNGVWSVTIQEGSGKKQKTRREERPRFVAM